MAIQQQQKEKTMRYLIKGMKQNGSNYEVKGLTKKVWEDGSESFYRVVKGIKYSYTVEGDKILLFSYKTGKRTHRGFGYVTNEVA
jgi:hypothetical protein